MKLKDYIDKHHNGIASQFAEANGFKRQQVDQCLSKGYYHVVEIEGVKMLVIAKREII